MDRHRAPDLAGGEPGEPRLLLVGRAGQADGLRGEDRAEPGAGHGAGAERPGDDRGVEQAEADAVVLLGDEHGEPALLADRLPELGRVAVALGVVVDGTDLGGAEPVAQVGADRVLQRALLVGESELHGD